MNPPNVNFPHSLFTTGPIGPELRRVYGSKRRGRRASIVWAAELLRRLTVGAGR